MDYRQFYHVMADGTVKQVNPFTGTEVWTVPGRGRRIMTEPRSAGTPLGPDLPHDGLCSFCPTRYYETAPEKARVIRRNGSWETLTRIPPSDYHAHQAELRRVSNLFEIVSIDYWRRNYSYKLSRQNLDWKESYISDPVGLKHILDILDYKLSVSGRSDDEISAVPMEEKIILSDAFFGGGHDLIIVKPHVRDDATSTSDMFATGDMTDDEHHQYYMFIIESMRDILENNRYVRYISVYKNWLRPAGATFDHLHAQLVAIDEWGERIDRQIKMVVHDKNIYNTFGPNMAGHHNLIFAENDAALALVGIGHRYPTVEIYSKSPNARPYEHTSEEVRGMSDIVRACHAAIGSDVSINEEWYHTPVDSIFKMPWHINIKLRINVPAGFEGGTNIFINPLNPLDLRDRLVPRLYTLRDERRIDSGIRIAEECRLAPNPLLYYKNT